jgi:hypothetical protein
MTLPAKMGFQGTRTRFDELQAVHAMAGEQIHVNVSRLYGTEFFHDQLELIA